MAGARPQRGLNRAIAEWPTSSGPADYVLFVGLTSLGVAEAKRHIKDVSGCLPQARRYSRGFVAQGSETFPGGHALSAEPVRYGGKRRGRRHGKHLLPVAVVAAAMTMRQRHDNPGPTPGRRQGFQPKKHFHRVVKGVG